MAARHNLRLSEAQLAEIIRRSKVRVVTPSPEPKTKSRVLTKKYAFERKLQQHCEAERLRVPVLEYKFLKDRKFRFDLAWVDLKIACEIDGMVHRIKKQWLSDMEKMNLARENGWSVVHVTPKMISTGQAIALIRRALNPQERP